MFIKNSFETEISESMLSNLVKSSENDVLQYGKIIHAMQFVKKASEAFASVGMIEESSALDRLLKSMASGCDCPVSDSNDASGIGTVNKKELDQEAKNMKETGTPFSRSSFKADDGNVEKEEKDDEFQLDKDDLYDLENMVEDQFEDVK